MKCLDFSYFFFLILGDRRHSFSGILHSLFRGTGPNLIFSGPNIQIFVHFWSIKYLGSRRHSSFSGNLYLLLGSLEKTSYIQRSSIFNIKYLYTLMHFFKSLRFGIHPSFLVGLHLLFRGLWDPLFSVGLFMKCVNASEVLLSYLIIFFSIEWFITIL